MVLPPEITFDKGTLLARGFPAVESPLTSLVKAWNWDVRVNGWRTDARNYHVVVEQANVGGDGVKDTVPAWQQIQWPLDNLKRTRAHQKDAIEAWERSRRGIVVMPTGTGKTDVALDAMRRVSASTLVVAPIRDLMYQWQRRIKEALGYDAGILGDSIRNVRPVTVTTYDSACIHMPELGNRFKLVVFDEAHHLPGQVRGDAARMCAAPYRLGLTATPERLGSETDSIETLIGPICYRMPISAATGGILADYSIKRVSVFLSDEEQQLYDRLGSVIREYVAAKRQNNPRFQWQNLYAEMATDPEARRVLAARRKRQSIEDRAEEKLRIIEDLFRLHRGSPTIIFAGSNLMARAVALRFLIPCLLENCGKAERQEILEGFEERRFPAIVANQVLDEGIDLPAAKVAVIIGGHSSSRQATQRLGRILRKSGDQRATLYEVVCAGTSEELRSRKRRNNDAYKGARTR